MQKSRIRIIGACTAAVLFGGLAASPASAVSIIWKAPNVDITLGLPYNNLEFEDPTAIGQTVKGYTIIDWRDADYKSGSPPWYDEWSVLANPSGALIDGNINEIWMRQAGQSITTSTTVPSSTVSIHMIGDNNDGKAEVLVDGVVVAILDMGTPGLSQTALIIVKNLASTSTHNIVVQDSGIGPISRIGDDVATLGAAALNIYPYGYKWWPPFWYLNARIRLYYSWGYIGVPTGFWWGWYPYYWYGYYWYPWYGPSGWYQPYCYYWYRPYWDYWPYYRYYRPWWHYWRWRGGWRFWGFNDYLRFRYTYWQPRIIYYWSWYWDAPGEGGCMELVTQANEANPAGERILPFPDPYIPGFEAGEHEFSVNGGKVTGTFSDLTFIPVVDVNSFYHTLPGVTPELARALMESEIMQKLLEHPGGYVGVQFATWDHPDCALVTNADIPEVRITEDTSGGPESEYTFEISLNPAWPSMAEAVTVISSAPEELELVGAGTDGAIHLTLTPGGTANVTVRAVPDAVDEEEHKVMVAAFLDGNETEGFSLDVIIQDAGCGGLGYNQSDLNHDCVTDFKDVAITADEWLYSTLGM